VTLLSMHSSHFSALLTWYPSHTPTHPAGYHGHGIVSFETMPLYISVTSYPRWSDGRGHERVAAALRPRR
jgi:hypothetical protein